MLSDMRSDCDPCADPELNYAAALHCPCPVPEVLARLKASIDGHGAGAARGDEIVVPVPPGTDTRPETQRVVEEYVRGRGDAVIRLHCAAEREREIHAPLFLMALRIVLACGAMQRPVCVVLPAHHMGYPGSTLTVRRALRCLLQTHGGHSISAHDLEELFANLARRLRRTPPTPTRAPSLPRVPTLPLAPTLPRAPTLTPASPPPATGAVSAAPTPLVPVDGLPGAPEVY